jgi:TonB family protein
MGLVRATSAGASPRMIAGMRTRALLTMLAVLVWIAPPALAVEKRIADRWTEQLVTTTDLLKARSYGLALPTLRKLIDEMLAVLGPGDESTYVLIVPLIQTAIAEEGLGDHEGALWHWDIAQTLYPKCAESDLSMFGNPGEVLKKHLLVDPSPAKCQDPGKHKPTVLTHLDPGYPEGARQFRIRGIVIIDLLIKADGSCVEPRVVKPLAPTLTYAAVVGLRKWKFKPAEVDGHPIDSTFCITINFKLIEER